MKGEKYMSKMKKAISCLILFFIVMSISSSVFAMTPTYLHELCR